MAAVTAEVSIMTIAHTWSQRGMYYFVPLAEVRKFMNKNALLIWNMTSAIQNSKKQAGHQFVILCEKNFLSQIKITE